MSARVYPQLPPPCERKRFFLTKESAKKAALRGHQLGKSRHRRRPYKCPDCRGWHLTGWSRTDAKEHPRGELDMERLEVKGTMTRLARGEIEAEYAIVTVKAQAANIVIEGEDVVVEFSGKRSQVVVKGDALTIEARETTNSIVRTQR